MIGIVSVVAMMNYGPSMRHALLLPVREVEREPGAIFTTKITMRGN